VFQSIPRTIEGVMAELPAGLLILIVPMCVTLLLSLLVLLVLAPDETEEDTRDAFDTPFASADPVCQRLIACSGESPEYPFVPSKACIALKPVLSSGNVAIFLPP
jgi:hypothetical protein